MALVFPKRNEFMDHVFSISWFLRILAVQAQSEKNMTCYLLNGLSHLDIVVRV